MPYVRARGNHIAIVHGSRHPTTKKVEQQVLLAIRSKEEALAAMGETAQPRRLRLLLERRYPGIRFDWASLTTALGAMMDRLPEEAPERKGAVSDAFRENLLGFAKQLALVDPQCLTSARDLLQSQRTELEWLAKLINWRLEALDHASDNEWTRDPFGWVLALSRPEVPPDLEEEAADCLDRNELDRAEKIFALLVEAFPGYAVGSNYLGLVALRRGDAPLAIDHFERTVRIGRTLFPRRIPKKDYWTRHETRPYMRGLSNLMIAFTRCARYDEALTVARRIEDECGDSDGPERQRILIHMNRGEWSRALELSPADPMSGGTESLLVALAAVEEKDDARARSAFVAAVLSVPATIPVLLGYRSRSRVHSYQNVRDHNEGVELHASLSEYLARRSTRSKRFMSKLWQHPKLVSLRDELDTLEQQREAERGGDRTAFDRLTEIRTPRFAATTVAALQQKKGKA